MSGATRRPTPSSERPLRIVFPYTPLQHPRAIAALERFAPEARRVDVSRSDRAYAELLMELWADPQETLLVEHDIELHTRVVAAARRCRQPWGAWPYNGPGFRGGGDPLLRESLGCTHFSRKLMEAEPDLIALAASVNQGLPPGDWRRMDAQIAPLLKQRGYTVHVHHPPVLHHHVYPNEGCACGQEHA